MITEHRREVSTKQLGSGDERKLRSEAAPDDEDLPLEQVVVVDETGGKAVDWPLT